MSDSACGDTEKCANGYCRDLVNCKVNEDCAFCPDPTKCPSDACIDYRCKCNTDADCGSIGRCDEDNRCVRTDDPPECGRSCLVNTECNPLSNGGQPGDAGTNYNCTFDEDHPYVGLCCPTFIGEPPQSFSCDINQNLATNSGALLLTTLAVSAFMGRILRRAAARKRNSARTRSSPSPGQM